MASRHGAFVTLTTFSSRKTAFDFLIFTKKSCEIHDKHIEGIYSKSKSNSIPSTFRQNKLVYCFWNTIYQMSLSKLVLSFDELS